MDSPRVLLGVSGASGAVYARRLLAALLDREPCVGLVTSQQGLAIAADELGASADDPVTCLLGRPEPRVIAYRNDAFDSPFATGSAPWASVVIAPCSMGTVGRIAAGVSDSLITRAADVALKERRRLVLVPRETPLSVIHLRNLTTLAEAGATIVPPAPGFYTHATTFDDLIDFVVARIMAHC